MLGRSRTYYNVFCTGQDGRWVLNDIMKSSGAFDIIVPPLDPVELAYKEGRRSLALEILAYTGTRQAAVAKRLEELADSEPEI